MMNGLLVEPISCFVTVNHCIFKEEAEDHCNPAAMHTGTQHISGRHDATMPPACGYTDTHRHGFMAKKGEIEGGVFHLDRH